MKNKVIKTTAMFAIALTMISALSSCNRNGYGCPYELKVPVSIVKCAVK